jgi:hypothetical protein
MDVKRQLKEIVETKGKVFIPKIAPYVKAIKYFGKGIPLKQISAIDNLLVFTRLLDQHGINYFLSGGTLLGSVRQKAFAGRPGDIDLAILEQDEKRFLALTEEIEGLGFARDANYVHHPDKLVFTKWRTPHVDVMVYRATGTSSNSSVVTYRHINASGEPFTCPIDFTVPRFGKIFSYEFPIPVNSEDFIENQYGASWRTPDAPQPSLRHR